MIAACTKTISLVALCLGTVAIAAAAPPQVDRLRCEYLENPLGIDVTKPRLNWLMRSDERGQRQTAYQILVAGSRELLEQDRGDLWDTGRVDSDRSIQIEYAGKPLTSNMECWWKVRVWDKDGQPTAWSKSAHWSMGILDPAEWQAKWLAYTKDLPYDVEWTQSAPSPVFRKSFKIDRPIRSAAITVCGLGFYELHLNGGRVGDHVLDPAFTRYDKRALYVTYDVTDRLKQGPNAIGAMLGNGWYNSHTRCTWNFDKAPWRDRPRLLVQLRVVLADGTVQTIASDGTWRATIGPIVRDAIRNGEVYDARREMPGWDAPGYDDSSWAAVEVVAGPKGMLRAQMLPAAKVMRTLTPISVTEPKPGVFIVDMGQNMAGWAQLKVAGPAGSRVVMRYAERIAPDGALDVGSLAQFVFKGPFQTDTYILKGQGEEVWEARFTYHGFRYVEVTGWPGKPTVDDFRGRVVHTAFEDAGSFQCSNDLLNKIQQMTLWTYRANFVDGYPTDCPQREKNGWTGDAHVAAEMAIYNFDNTAGYLKWINDFDDAQLPDGNLPGIVPSSGWGYQWGNGPSWDSAYILIPWYLQQYCGETRVFANHYDCMKRYVDFMSTKAKNDLVEHGLADWLSPKTETPAVVTSSGYYYVDATILAKIAAMLGKSDDAKKYGDLAEAIRSSYNKTLYKGNGIYANGSQTALACPIYQGLVAAGEKAGVVTELAANVRRCDNHLDTGFLGTKYLLPALSDNGQCELAFRIATQTTPPSWGDWVKRGATTLWEDWGDGASRNHFAFGVIGEWFYKTLAGINLDPNHPAFKHVIIRPRPVGDLKWVRARHESLYGAIASEWHRDANSFTLSVTIPPNTTAEVHVPTLFGEKEAITVNGRLSAEASGAKSRRTENGDTVFEVDSGRYEFVAKPKQ
jgi:alpha-L-rhamnosidase